MKKYDFNGKLLKVRRDQRRLPNGRMMKLEVIDHPGAALVAPMLTKNKMIFIRQWRPVINSYLLELPAGGMEKGETPLYCAKREIVEEAGYAAKKFTKLGKIFPVPGYSTEIIYLFKAEDLIKREMNLDPDEIIQTKILTPPEVRRLFRQGKITDAKTLCTLAYCGWL